MYPSPRHLVERFYDEVWDRADEGVARTILHPEFQFRGSLGTEHSGHDAFITYLRAVHAALEDYRCTIEVIVEGVAAAAARLRFRGTHRGRLFGVEPTGQVVAWDGAAFFVTDDDRIRSLWVLGDTDGLKRQLGAAPGNAFAD